jgi:hypothetical protein
MTDLLGAAQVILGDAKFRTRLMSVADVPALFFENDSVMGFVRAFVAAQDLLECWRDVELAFLRTHAPKLRQSGEKAWNVYSVFLSTGSAADDLQRSIRWIEENLERTRKIAVAGLASRAEVVQALLPLLPLQNQAVLGSGDVEARLRARFQALWPKSADAILRIEVEPTEVVQLLRRGE